MMGQGVWRKDVTTDASSTRWGALCNARPATGIWTDAQKMYSISFLELKLLPQVLQKIREELLVATKWPN